MKGTYNFFEKLFGGGQRMRLIEFFMLSPNAFFSIREMHSRLKASREIIDTYLRELLSMKFIVMEKRKLSGRKQPRNFYAFNDKDEIAMLLFNAYHKGNVAHANVRVRSECNRIGFMRNKMDRRQLKDADSRIH